MARNVEIKARIPSVESIRAQVAALADQGPVELEQDDTFFRSAGGRLKLRVFENGSGHLIFYRRPNTVGPKESFFVVTPSSDPDSLREVLSFACGQQGRVRKRRTLYRIGRTRVHLDRVEGLGDYLELEVELEDGEPASAGIETAQRLMAELRIAPGQLVEGAYLDLLAEQGAHPRPES